MATEFPDQDVAVILTGKEWAALLGRLAGQPLSAEGRRVCAVASSKLGDQLVASQEASARVPS